MTKESKHLLTIICNSKGWKDYGNTSDKLKKLIPDIDIENFQWLYEGTERFSFPIVLKFDSIESASSFQDSISELSNPGIHMVKDIKVGKMEYSIGFPHLLGAILHINNYLVIDVDRKTAKELFEDWGYLFSSGREYPDFLSWINRNGGKHWDDLLDSREEVPI